MYNRNYNDGYAHGNTVEETRYVGAGGGGKKGGPFQQLCCSLCISLIGILLYFGSLVMIGNNEMSSVCVARALNTAGADVETVPCTGEGADRYMTGNEVVHAACEVTNDSFLQIQPRDFAGAQGLQGAFSVKALKVRQEVSVYQCEEKKETRTEGEGNNKREITSYKYTQTWSSSHIESNDFRGWQDGEYRRAMENGCGRGFNGNPHPVLQTGEVSARKLVAGVYDLTRHLSQIHASSPISLNSGKYSLSGTASSLGPGASVQAKASDNKWYDATIAEDKGNGYFTVEWANGDTRDTEKQKQDIHLQNEGELQREGSYLYSCSPSRPTIGCTSIQYRQSTATSASFIARLTHKDGGNFETRHWKAPASWMCESGGSSNRVDLFAEGKADGDEIVANALSANQASMWLFRILGVFLCVLGVTMFLNPIQTVADLVDQFFDWFKWIPLLGWALDFFGNVVSGAVGCAIFMISLGVGLPSSLLVLSVFWCLMRPLLGIPMMIGSLCLFAYTVKTMYEYATIGKENRARAKTKRA